MVRDGIPSKCSCCGAYFINHEADDLLDIWPLDFCRGCAETGAATDWFYEEYVIGNKKITSV